jgi:hypothetical protein
MRTWQYYICMSLKKCREVNENGYLRVTTFIPGDWEERDARNLPCKKRFFKCVYMFIIED